MNRKRKAADRAVYEAACAEETEKSSSVSDKQGQEWEKVLRADHRYGEQVQITQKKGK